MSSTAITQTNLPGLSEGAKAGLGVGVGLGVSILIALVASGLLLSRMKRRNANGGPYLATPQHDHLYEVDAKHKDPLTSPALLAMQPVEAPTDVPRDRQERSELSSERT